MEKRFTDFGRWRSWFCRVDDRHGDQGYAEVANFGEQPVQRRLVGDDTGQARRAVVFVGQGEITDPGRPVMIQVPGDPKLVDGGCLPVGVLGS